MQSNKIGFFDSGLGGLVIAKAVMAKLPKYDYIYYGDTKNLPYGNKSQKQIYELTINALTYLFGQGCLLVVIACNTASAKALRKVQREFLPKRFPDRKVLGVIVPTIEEVVSDKKLKTIGIISTSSTAKSHAYKKEIQKIAPALKVFEQAAPKLVPMIENDTLELIDVPLKGYLSGLIKRKVNALVLGCTHYPILKKQIQLAIGRNIKVFSQEEIIPKKLALYLKKHKEISERLSKQSSRIFVVSKKTHVFEKISRKLFGRKINLRIR